MQPRVDDRGLIRTASWVVALAAALVLGCPVSRAAQVATQTAKTPIADTEASDLATAAREAEAEAAAAVAAERQSRQRTEQIKANLAAVREVLDIGLSGDEAGELLLEARQRAPDLYDLERQVAARERQVAEARLDRVRLMERRRLANAPEEVLRLSGELSIQEQYLSKLEEALAAERELAVEAESLVTLLDSRLLWIGSAPPIGVAWPAEVAQGAKWIASPQAWIGLVRTLPRQVWRGPVATALTALLIVLLLACRPRLKSALSTLSNGVGTHATDSFMLTVQAAAVTLLLALPIPLALACFGTLVSARTVDGFARAIRDGLFAAAGVRLLLGFFLQMCRPSGLADVHFGWVEGSRRTLLTNLRWLIEIETAAAFVVVTCAAFGEPIYRQGLGRLAFLVSSVGLVIFMARVFQPSRGVLAAVLSRQSWAWRLRKALYALLVAPPVVLSIAAIAGYYYAATEVLSRYFSSGAVVLGGIVLYSVMKRWLFVTRQRAAIQQARQKLAEQRQARQKQDVSRESGEASGEAVPDLETPTIDIAAASGQTLALLRTMVVVIVIAALWAVWEDILPALTVLQRVQLAKPTLDAAGAVVVEPITLWSLLLGIIAVVLTVIAARSLPAVLQLVVLERFPLDTGARYAATTLTRYAATAAGIVIASRLVGIDWSRAQWIIAALGVGLGFGLQEIVANFVSGLIILFERPVRVGDTVTVGDVSGTVSRLQIRATTITDWDNKEVLVPNKSFITERVVNWSLSNPITRLLVRVGVAYGTDVTLAHKAISSAVKSVPAVLADPAPSVLLVAFGESSLDFEVRVFVGELSKRLPTVHELHAAINAALAAANIVIPFPQRDLRIDLGNIHKSAAAIASASS